MIGPEIKKLFKIKVVTPTARHPVKGNVHINVNGRFGTRCWVTL